MSSQQIPEYEFIAYIDESGDPSLKRVRPIDAKGGTEWMALSAVVVGRHNEHSTKNWVTEITRDIGSDNNQVIHFKDLDKNQKLITANHIAKLPVRLFVVVSNKKNMRGYVNEKAANMHSRQWFYNWLARMLAERITDWCFNRAKANNLARRHVKFVFSKTGGHSYSQTAAYHELLKYQARGSRMILQKFIPRWEVMDWRLVENFPHYQIAGLQLADAVASSFYQAVDNLDTGPCEPAYAEALQPRIACNAEGEQHDYGVVLQPTPCWKADISEEQKSIFRFYGYNFNKRR